MNTKLKLIFSVLIFLGAVFAIPLASLEFSGRAPRINNLSFVPGQELVVPEAFSVSHSGETIDYFITFSAGVSGDTGFRYMAEPAGGVMLYNIFNNETERIILRDLMDNPSSGQVLGGVFVMDGTAKKVTRDHSFAVILDRNQFPPAGVYSDSLVISLYAGTPEAPVPGGPVDTMPLSLSARMGSVIELSLVDSGAPFNAASTAVTLDFGTLLAGNQRSADIIARANSVHTVTVRSQNSGVMIITDAADTSTVPYSFVVNGETLALDSGLETPLAVSAPPTDESGTRYSVEITILDYGMATQGLYSDTLFLTLSAP